MTSLLTPEQIAEIKESLSIPLGHLERVSDWDLIVQYKTQAKALLSHIESDGWQTMETAPKKPYYRVLLGSPEIPESASDDGYPAISTTGFYLDAEPDGPDSMGHDAGWVDEDYGTYDPGRSFGNPQYFRKPRQPTHWRPLPAPPETKE